MNIGEGYRINYYLQKVIAFSNSLKYVASKDKKECMDDLKQVYKADTKDLAAMALEDLVEKWEAG